MKPNPSDQKMERDLRKILKNYFGFDSFRPLQEEIVSEALAGRDVFALLPTGGGKSLCFQLPAMARSGLTLVVSPLIALMKDQVDSMVASGVPATFLNSSLDSAAAAERLRGLEAGEYRLLYVAPERVMIPGFMAELARWNIQMVAIDEAHCISEWGHDFRPEYRQIPQLRDVLPEVPFMALTATATHRVRSDIVQLLRLREPRVFVASFNRPNLDYRVLGKAKAYEQTERFIRQRPGESGIVYCLSRRGAEELAEKLRAEGIKALPYHAGLSPMERTKNQEAFIRDNIQVICGTIAFGMGINKPNVRFVIHHDLPKNVEGYYQESGRAGRDGLPSDCLLLFGRSDIVMLLRFIDQKPDPQEKRIARRQLDEMVRYAESPGCRRAFLLQYFGEVFPGDNCGSCDNCLNPREGYDGTIQAQKLLSCVYRIHRHSGFGTGLKHVAQVLVGERTENIRKWGHETLSTHGIGKELDLDGWMHVGRELARLGYVLQNPERFQALELTDAGRTFLKERGSVTLLKPVVQLPTKVPARDNGEYDTALFEELRVLRKALADERDVPSYVVFSDNTLREISRVYPVSEGEFARIAGVGEKKLREFSAPFTEAVAKFLAANPKRQFAKGASGPRPAPKKKRVSPTVLETAEAFRAGASPEEVAAARGLAPSTIYGHLEAAVLGGEPLAEERFYGPQEKAEMAAVALPPDSSLTEFGEALGGKYPWETLRIFRAFARRGQNPPRETESPL